MNHKRMISLFIACMMGSSLMAQGIRHEKKDASREPQKKNISQGKGRLIQRTPSLSRVSAPPKKDKIDKPPMRSHTLQHPLPSQQSLNPKGAQTPAQLRSSNKQGTQPTYRHYFKNQMQKFLQDKNRIEKKRPIKGVKDPNSRWSKQAALRQRYARDIQEKFNRDRVEYRRWFNRDFFDRHRFYPNYYTPRHNWWRGTGWVGLSSWLGWNWGYPIYYTRYGYPINFSTGEVYVLPEAGYQDYYDIYNQSNINIVVPERQNIQIYEESSQSDWMPLGTFVIAKDPSAAAVSNMFIQLALNRQGDISGTYYNSLSDQAYPVEGMVDRLTQLAIWKLSDRTNSPLMMTGMYNLTQDAVNIEVHFNDGSSQKWELFRLQD